MLLQFSQFLALLTIFCVSGLDVPLESYPALSESNSKIVEYPQRTAFDKNEESEPFVRIHQLTSKDSREPVSRNIEESRDTTSFGKLPSQTNGSEENVPTKNLKNVAPKIFDDSPRKEKPSDFQIFRNPKNQTYRDRFSKRNNTLTQATSLMEYIDENFDYLQGNRNLSKKNETNDDLEKQKNFNREKFVESGEDVVEKPNLRILDENDELGVIPALQTENLDFDNLKKVNSNESITHRSFNYFLDNRESPGGQTTIIHEATTISTKQTTERASNSSGKKLTKRRKKKKISGKIKRKRISLRVRSKKKDASRTSREMKFVGHTRKSQVPGFPVVYSEKSRSSTNEKIKKYQGIDRRPTIRPLLRNLKTKPEMELLHYDTIIRSRYARTTVTGRVNNYGRTRDININVILPRSALITKFETTVNGGTIAAVVRDKNSTTELPKTSVNGVNVGTMLTETRDCDAVTLAVKVSSDSKLNYTVTYEYLLKRNLGFYAVPITVHNNMWIKDLMVRWRIQEERNLTSIKTPLIYGTTALPVDNSDDPTVCIINEEPGIAELIWQPTISEQKNISRELGELSKHGVVGILEIKYDVLHDQDPCGQVVRQDGYFAQFFAAPNQPSLTKHVVFILDVSDSMQGDPIKQLKTAMYYILDTLQPIDHFTLINFSDEVNIMNIYDRARDIVYRGVGVGPDGRGEKSGKTEWPGNLKTYEATASNVEAAKEAVKMMDLRVFTNIYDALIMGFKSVKDMTSLPPAQTGQPHPEPFIIFLTDGHASDGPSYDHDVILKMVEDQNHNTKATMFALGFGGEADMGLLRRFALATNGIEKHIYKDIDAADQLVTFFQSIKAPVLKDVYFKYNSKQVITASLTEQSFPMIHRGKEVIIAGQLDPSYPHKSSLYVDVTALGRYTMIRCERIAEKSRKFGDDNGVTKYSNATAMRHDTFGTRSNETTSARTVERIWGFRTLSRLRDEVELDHLETHQDTRCDDALKPLDRMLEICLRLNYAMPTVTNLVYNDTIIERVSISPESGDNFEETTQYDPLAQYPWILKLRDKHGFAKLPIMNQKKGRMYTYLSLGVNESPPPPRSCADAIDGSPGECRYLPECPDPRVLGSPQKFRRHFCRLGSYAGVCCSDSVPRTGKPKR